MIKAVTYYSVFVLCLVITLGETEGFPTFEEYIVQFGKVYDNADEYEMRK